MKNLIKIILISLAIIAVTLAVSLAIVPRDNIDDQNLVAESQTDEDTDSTDHELTKPDYKVTITQQANHAIVSSDSEFGALVVVSWNSEPSIFYSGNFNQDLTVEMPREHCSRNGYSGEDCDINPADQYLVEVFACDELSVAGYSCDLTYTRNVDGGFSRWPANVIHRREYPGNDLYYNRESYAIKFYPRNIEPIASQTMSF